MQPGSKRKTLKTCHMLFTKRACAVLTFTGVGLCVSFLDSTSTKPNLALQLADFDRPKDSVEGGVRGKFVFPASCQPKDFGALNWDLIRSHPQRVDVGESAQYALIDESCDLSEPYLQHFSRANSLFVVERRPTQDWKEREKFNSLGTSHIRFVVTNCRVPYFRPGQDLCIPLKPKANCPGTFLAKKRWYATFKGTMYFNGRGHHRYLLKVFHNPEKKVLVHLTTRHETNDKQIPVASNLTRRNFDKAEAEAAKYDYCDLLNSTFSFAPGGRSPASYRFLESLGSGAVPILFFETGDEDTVLPYENILDWSGCVTIKTSIAAVEQLLLSSGKSVRQRQRACEMMFEENFRNEEISLDTFLRAARGLLDGSDGKNI
jgi:hypothetical protein